MRQGYQLTHFIGDGVANGSEFARVIRWRDALSAGLLAVIFSFLVPLVEWPDAKFHIDQRLSGQTIYPPDFLSVFSDSQNSVVNDGYSVFADKYMYRLVAGSIFLNIERLAFVLALIVGLYFIASKFGSRLILFCPPIIYSLMAPSQEAVAIAIFLIAAIFAHQCAVCAALLVSLSIFIDRSMVPNGFFLALYVALSPFRSVVTDRKWVFLVGGALLLMMSFFSPLDIIGAAADDTKLVFGLTVEDIKRSAELGQQKFFALAASTMGLYGWLSIRPFPFFIYYPLVGVLFVAGFLSSDSSRQSVFTALFVLACMVLWLIPTLAQARYYPLLTLGFWSMVVSGARVMKISRTTLYLFVVLATAAGCGVSLLNAM